MGTQFSLRIVESIEFYLNFVSQRLSGVKINFAIRDNNAKGIKYEQQQQRRRQGDNEDDDDYDELERKVAVTKIDTSSLSGCNLSPFLLNSLRFFYNWMRSEMLIFSRSTQSHIFGSHFISLLFWILHSISIEWQNIYGKRAFQCACLLIRTRKR